MVFLWSVRGALIVLALQVMVILWLTSHSGFMYDDFVSDWIVEEQGGALGWRYLLRDAYGHLVPGQRFLSYWVTHRGQFSWSLVVMAQVLGNSLTVLTAWRLSRILISSKTVCTLTTALVALSPSWTSSWLWWSAGSDALLSVPAMLFALELAIRRIQGGGRIISVGIGATMTFALSFRERPAILVGVFALLVLVLVDGPLGRRVALRKLATLWDVWVACLVPVIGYVVLLAHGQYMFSQVKENPGGIVGTQWVQYLGFYQAFIFKNLLAQFVGVLPEFWPHPLAAAAVADVVVIGAIIVTLVVMPGAWRAWTFFFLSAVVSILPVAVARGGSGAGFATEPRFAIEIMPFALVTVGLIVRGYERRRAERVGSRRSRGLLPACGAFGVLFVFVACGLYSSRQYEARWASVATAKHLRMAVDALPRDPSHTVLEAHLPATIILPFMVGNPYGRLSRLLSARRPDVAISSQSARDISVVQPNGTMARYTRGTTLPVPFGELRFSGEGARLDSECGFIDGIHPARVTVEIPPTFHSPDAVMVEVVWQKDLVPAYVTPVALREDGQGRAQEPVPASGSQFPTMAIIDSGASSTRVGFDVPAGAQACVTQFKVTSMSRD